MATPTDEQRNLILHNATQNARVLAGPGTGKSFTLVAFLERLLSRDNPPNVRLLTFTRAATSELAEKVSGHPAAGAERPSTIHSFAISVLLRNPGAAHFPEPLRIADDWERRNIVEKTLASRSGFPLRQLRDLTGKMAANWESLVEPDFDVSEADKARFLGTWNEHRRVYGYTLLQELPYALLKALEAHDDLKGVDFDLLLVDEYQDLNACDLALLHRLAERGCTIIGAGDDDQSIYSARHANPAGIRRFPQEYPGAADYPLSVTLRCGQRIIDWANFVIQGDPDRPRDRPVLTPHPTSPSGEVGLLRFKSNVAEARGVAALAHGLMQQDGLAPSDILILLRTDHNRAFSNPIRDELSKLDIPNSDPSYVAQMFTEESNRRALATLRLLAFPRDSLAWATLLELTPRIGPSVFDYIYARALPGQSTFAQTLLDAHDAGYPDAPRGAASKLGEVVGGLLRLLDTFRLPDGVPENGWQTWLLEQVLNGKVPEPSDEFLDLVREVEEQLTEDESLSLPRLLSQLQPIGGDIAQARGNGVRIMTMVGSKGLTVEAAILVGLEEELVPRPGADLNEERRIVYVAMTRAKRFLFGTWAGRRQGPTARAGSGSATHRRTYSTFLQGGPVETQDAEAFLARRF